MALDGFGWVWMILYVLGCARLCQFIQDFLALSYGWDLKIIHFLYTIKYGGSEAPVGNELCSLSTFTINVTLYD